MPATVLAPKETQTKPVLKETVSPKKGFVGFDLYGWLVNPQRFTPIAFFVGVAVAFALCSFAGRVVSKHNIYHNFHRFHDYISPASLYYPTISQMISIVESQSKPEQTVVIVGGNSVFFGLGQNQEDLWSDKLQSMLGDKYAVFNFANPSSGPFEWGYWTAEALLKKHRKVIYATIAVPGKVGEIDGSDVYGYGYWDAHDKNLLVHDKFRDAKVEQRISALNDKEQLRIAELRMKSKFDGLFYFEDLWNAVAYEKFFTVWTHLTSANPLKPHKDYADARYYPGPVEGRFKSDVDLASIRSYSKSYFEYNSATPRESFWYKLQGDMYGLIPHHLKKNCLVVVGTHTPSYLDRLSPVERTREDLASSRSVETWVKAGYHSTSLAGELANEDFLDCRHLIASGGQKVATIVASKVQSMNKELGY